MTEPTFKVRDRRRFDADGEERAEAPEEPSKPVEESQAGPYPIDFMGFIASLATNALAAMGVLKGGEMPLNRELAKQYIDIISMLQEKTRGNLAPEEASGLQQILTDLRMGFVQSKSIQ